MLDAKVPEPFVADIVHRSNRTPSVWRSRPTATARSSISATCRRFAATDDQRGEVAAPARAIHASSEIGCSPKAPLSETAHCRTAGPRNDDGRRRASILADRDAIEAVDDAAIAAVQLGVRRRCGFAGSTEAGRGRRESALAAANGVVAVVEQGHERRTVAKHPSVRPAAH